jgi:5-methyltetrahydropteroyltriglutamate--homocysteine methyltransferase
VAPSAPHDPPFRAEHVGSFLRPPELLAARDSHAKGRISASELRAREDAAIRDVVKLQESLGLEVVTDGEYRRGSYSDNFTTSGLGGVTAEFSGEGAWAYSDRQGHKTAARVPTVHGRLEWTRSQNAEDFRFLKGLTGRLAKMTIPGPAYLHYRAGRAHISREAYPNLDQFWSDLVDCYRQELAALGAAGCSYVQMDETSLAKLGDPKIQKALADRGDDWRALLETYTDVINQVVEAAPTDMRIGIHLCRGNNRGHWQAEAGYDAIAEALFRKLAIDVFFLEYDSPRAGTFEPLAAVPDGKVVVLGLVSTKVADLEPADLLKRRIAEASRYVPLDRLCLSPQCGFASSHEGNPITPADQSAKLERVIEVAREVWPG